MISNNKSTASLLQSIQSLTAEHSTQLFSEDVVTWLFLIQPTAGSSTEKEILEKCGNKLRSYLSVQTPHDCYQLFSEDYSVFLLPFPKDASYQTAFYELSIQLTFLSEQNDVHYYIGAEKLFSPEETTLSVTHALECIKMLQSIHAHRGVCSYEHLTFFQMFGMLHRTEHSIVLNNHALQLLLNYDRENQTNYVHTIRTYLADNCNISRTAERLFIHRHTLMKRLDKIQALSGINFNDYYTRIYMSLALLFHDYFAD